MNIVYIAQCFINADQAVGQAPFYLSATPETWKSALREWSQSHNKSTPLISDEMLRRDNLYEDHEDR